MFMKSFTVNKALSRRLFHYIPQHPERGNWAQRSDLPKVMSFMLSDRDDGQSWALPSPHTTSHQFRHGRFSEWVYSSNDSTYLHNLKVFTNYVKGLTLPQRGYLTKLFWAFRDITVYPAWETGSEGEIRPTWPLMTVVWSQTSHPVPQNFSLGAKGVGAGERLHLLV